LRGGLKVEAFAQRLPRVKAESVNENVNVNGRKRRIKYLLVGHGSRKNVR